MDIREEILNHQDELIDNLATLVSYESVQKEKEGDAPFGEALKDCLNEALEMGKEYGFKTCNLDNYCGYIEMGCGEDVIGILTHLDVVPAGDGWKTEPYYATIMNDRIYGRGTSDDKGAFVATLFAMKCLKEENVPLTKRIRLIVGCNEESGSQDMKYYLEKEGQITMGFTPDAEFPGIHGEKGRILLSFETKNTNLIHIEGGESDNTVADKCIVVLNHTDYNQDKFLRFMKQNGLDCDIKTKQNLDELTIYGTSAHASTPEMGKNAIMYTISGLKYAGMKDAFIDTYSAYFGLDLDGKRLGIACSDEYGILTMNQGIITMKKGVITWSLDIRFPVTFKLDNMIQKIKSIFLKNCNIKVLDADKSLYYEKDTPFIQALLKAYQKVINDTSLDLTTSGGGTYAKLMNHCIAFGCSFGNVDHRLHQANEFVGIDELLLQVEIYYYAIKNLLNM